MIWGNALNNKVQILFIKRDVISMTEEKFSVLL